MPARKTLDESKPHWSSRTTRTLSVLGRRGARDGRFRFDLGLRGLAREWSGLLSTKDLRADVVAGLTVACIAIPLSFAIALASDVKPEIGLISAIVAGIVCAVFGGTPLAVSGPAAAMSVLVAANVEQFGLGGLLVIGLVCGLLQLFSGVFGLGSLARYVPTPVIAGFTAGIGVIILVGQLPRALGLPPPDQSHVLGVLQHLVDFINHMQPMVFVLTLITMALMLSLPRRLPKLPAPLVAVAVPTALVPIFALNVPLVGDIPRELPMPHLPAMPSEWAAVLAAGFIVYCLASLETLLSSSAVDRLAKGQRHDPDQELIGQGLGNIAVSLFGGIPVTGVIARSALNVQSGAKTRRASIIHSLTLLAVVFLFAPVMSRIPVAALAGVLLSVALRMLDPRELRAIYHTSPADAGIYVVTALVVVFVDLIAGVQAGIVMALLIAALRLGQTRVQVHRMSGSGPFGFSLSGSLTFFSTAKLDKLRRRLEKAGPDSSVLIDLSRLTLVDSSGAAEFAGLVDSLHERGAKVVLKGLSPNVARPLLAADESGHVKRSLTVSQSEVLARVGGGRLSAARSRLLSGVERFERDLKQHYQPLLDSLAHSQTPHTLFITCSDSRLSPGLFTSTEPGELFIVRNVGNVVPPCGTDSAPAEGAAVEYAVGVLGVSQIVVCGHSGCGAVKAAFSSADLSKLPSVDQWLTTMRTSLAGRRGDLEFDAIGRLNVVQQFAHLMTYPSVKEGVEKGTLRLSAWFFDVGLGQCFEWLPEKKDFVAITSLEHAEWERQKG